MKSHFTITVALLLGAISMHKQQHLMDYDLPRLMRDLEKIRDEIESLEIQEQSLQRLISDQDAFLSTQVQGTIGNLRQNMNNDDIIYLPQTISSGIYDEFYRQQQIQQDNKYWEDGWSANDQIDENENIFVESKLSELGKASEKALGTLLIDAAQIYLIPKNENRYQSNVESQMNRRSPADFIRGKIINREKDPRVESGWTDFRDSAYQQIGQAAINRLTNQLSGSQS
ncbi:UNKNOWN [Stylonychia lemnae]|uniref:Uncharacterized protein n=1 Tax=Stylonychia lemnae TaxID=5949 RepID=A0A078AH10_STYLE|nr:UNKNOWN [Stylonychia lemnae]|eukprot:CDW81116.1 UNKNOWN [Stylonychia lemnae]